MTWECNKPAPDGGQCLECCMRQAIADYYKRTRNDDGLMDSGETLDMMLSVAAELLADYDQGLVVAYAFELMAMAARDRDERRQREHRRAAH